MPKKVGESQILAEKQLFAMKMQDIFHIQWYACPGDGVMVGWGSFYIEGRIQPSPDEQLQQLRQLRAASYLLFSFFFLPRILRTVPKCFHRGRR